MKGKEIAGKTMQDIGISILLASLLVGAIVMALGSEALFLENMVMMIFTYAAVVFAAFKLTTVAYIVAGAETVLFIALKVYTVIVGGQEVNVISFLWIVLPALSVFGMVFFMNGLKSLKMENSLLQRQVEELVMIDPLTGFYNLRSMFMDIQTQISYAERNKSAISLMIVKFRYQKELKSVLKRSQYEEVIIRLAKGVYDTVRLEDRVYSIDKDGTVAILLTCDKAGARIVENRLRSRLSDEKFFANIADSPIRVDLKIGSLQYKASEFKRDAKLFKTSVEDEVEYDI